MSILFLYLLDARSEGASPRARLLAARRASDRKGSPAHAWALPRSTRTGRPSTVRTLHTARSILAHLPDRNARIFASESPRSRVVRIVLTCRWAGSDPRPGGGHRDILDA